MPLDVGLDSSGDLPHATQHIDGIKLIIQRVTIRLNMALGEWVLDQTQGLDYFAFARQRPVDVDGIGAIIRAEIENTPGVTRIENFESIANPAPDGVGLALQFSGRVVVEPETEADEQLIGLSIGVEPAVGNSHPAVVTYHRIGLVAPHTPVFGGIT
jgi:hypothetical protein